MCIRDSDGDDVLAADVNRAGNHALHDAGVVADVDKGQVFAVLTTFGHPSAHPYRGPHFGRPDPSAEMGAHRCGTERSGDGGHDGSFRRSGDVTGGSGTAPRTSATG